MAMPEPLTIRTIFLTSGGGSMMGRSSMSSEPISRHFSSVCRIFVARSIATRSLYDSSFVSVVCIAVLSGLLRTSFTLAR